MADGFTDILGVQGVWLAGQDAGGALEGFNLIKKRGSPYHFGGLGLLLLWIFSRFTQ